VSDTETPRGYPDFPGTVGRTFAGSTSWWPERATPRRGAPNVVIMLADDLGYSDLGCYGSEIPTPHLDALAARGVRLTNFHSTPMCSPTRAALLTGLGPHRVGFGSVAHSDSGFPGYAMELPDRVETLAEAARARGYATLMVGKWHLCKDSDASAAGPQHSWPCQRGFDRFYGFLDAFTNLHQPHRLTRDNSTVETDEYPEGYYLTDDLTDRAISMLRERRASNPEQPFLLYFAHGAVHAPLHAKPADIERHRGRYDAGWDALRAERFARQQELGIVAPGTEVAPRNTEEQHDVVAWDSLGEQERELFARHMEVYAGMVDNIDQNVGRLVAALEELGVLDDTIFVFTSDNGASREGEAVGTSSYYVHLLQGDDVAADHARLDLLGGPRTTPHYPRGWAMASNTPFRLYKINTHQGGHSVPCIVSWPAGLPADGSLRRQWGHVTDLFPTILEAIDGAAPTAQADGTTLEGASLLPALREPDASSAHREQAFEMNGHRGYYRDGWHAVTLHLPMTPFDGERWELYDLERDPTELHDLAEREPERLAELVAAWERAAWEQRIYPLDEGTSLKYLIRPPRSEVYRAPVTILPGTPTLERWRSVQLIWFRSCTITIEVSLGAEDRGHLVAHGDQGAGYAVYVLDGHVHYVHHDGRGRLRELDGGPIAPGRHTVTCDLRAAAGNTWTVGLRVDDGPESTLDGVPFLYGMAPFEGIDVGIDRRSPVSWPLFERFGAFAFTGTLGPVRFAPGEDAPGAPSTLVDMLRGIGLRFE
jgi:arylsulfatase